MKLDCTDSRSTADETKSFQTTENNEFPEGTHVSEPDKSTGPVVEKRSKANAQKVQWCYLFVHHRKVKSFEEQLEKDGIIYFVHKTIKYVPRHRNKGGVREVEIPSVSGLIFLQGTPKKLQAYLDEKLQPYRLCKNCSTGKVATIPCSHLCASWRPSPNAFASCSVLLSTTQRTAPFFAS